MVKRLITEGMGGGGDGGGGGRGGGATIFHTLGFEFDLLSMREECFISGILRLLETNQEHRPDPGTFTTLLL